ncbi:HAD family hydrolase, partial [Veillonella sp.]|uniref:HAD family hydrolase n=1 Tax=Veillonella sp. TaxID=1926307 RepID=UPI00345B7BCA
MRKIGMTMKFTDTRLLAIDLDETLLRSDNTVSNYTKEIMNAVRGRGIDIVLATGRMYQT